MKIGITGASGFIGQTLVRHLNAGGHGCIAFSRSPNRPVAGCRETRAFRPGQPVDLWDLDAMVNLAGENIFGRLTKAKRGRILESRVGGTGRIVQAIRDSPVERGSFRLVNASATGFYGDRGDEVLEEGDAPGRGFLADVCRQWEDAALTVAAGSGVRVACLRIGFTLGRDGGPWPLLRRIFGLGLGGRLGDGQQWMSLGHVEDVAGLIVFLLEHEGDDPAETSGVFNAVCPQPVRNADFTAIVARALHRPAVLPVPAWALRVALGDLSRLMLDSQRVVPSRAQALGFEFRFPTLGAMLADVGKA